MHSQRVGEMMLQETVVPVEFTKGVETKSDPKTVIPGKFIRLENAIFTKPGQLAKRNGYTVTGTAIIDNTGSSIGTVSAPKMVHGYQNELLAADQNLLISYSSNQDAWSAKASYASVELSREPISEDIGSSGIASVAILGNYALYAWSNTVGDIVGAVADISTGDILRRFTLVTGAGLTILDVRCVLLGGTTLAVIYRKTAIGEYGARTIVFSGGGIVNPSAETVITTTATGVGFDIVPTATGGAFIYTQSTTPGITVATLSTALAVSTVSIAATNPQNVAISTTSNNNIWIYWNETTNDGAGNLTASTIYYAVYSSVLAPVLAKTSLVVLASPYYVSNMMAKADSATQQTLYYGLFKTNNHGAAHMLEYTNYITATSAGVVGSATLFANGVMPYSHPFTVGSSIYAVFYYRASDITVTIGGSIGAPVQPTLFVVELTNITSPLTALTAPPYVVARFAAGVASSYNGLYQTTIFCQNIAAFSSTKFYFACGVTIQAFSNPSTFIGGLLASYAYCFDFDSANAYIAKTVSDVVVLNGACLQLYDGANANELNYHLFPEITNISFATPTAGSVANGLYSYIAIYQWVDDQGNLHQSAPSLPVSVTVAGAASDATVTLTITTAFLSRKVNPWVAIYRTVAGGSVYFLVTDPVIVTAVNPNLGAIITFADTLADASIVSRNQAYTYPASSVLENSTPPPSMITLAHNNRLWFVDSENKNTIWYTKSSENLVGLSPSAFLTEQIDAKFGNISGLAEMDEKLVIGKTNGFFVQAGDGANDVGSGSTLTFPQFVPSDVGISTLKSIIAQPNGVMFKSANGIYMLTRSLQVVYIGAEVESYNSQTVTSVTLVPGKSQIRFLCSSGLTLVYDYIFNQWSTFTNHTGTSSTAWNNTYVYATTSGSVFRESSSSYLDNATAYALLAQTSWLSFATIQGFQRIRRLIALGDYVNGNSASHNLSISAAYDFSTTFQTAITYAFGATSSSGVFQYRERLPQQKCDSLSLLIQETTTGSSLEYVDITNLSFEVGVKKGLNKLRGQQSVG